MAARDRAGRLWLSLVNVDPDRPAHVDAMLPGIAVHGATGQMLTGDAVDAHNDFASPNTVEPVPIAARTVNGHLSIDLPPKSVAVVELR